MMNEKLLKYKGIYLDTTVSQAETEKNWKRLERKLGEQNPKTNFRKVKFAASAFAVLFVVTFVTAGVSQAAKPGDTLYPIKILSKNITSNLNHFKSDVQNLVPNISNHPHMPTSDDATKPASSSAAPTSQPTVTEEKQDEMNKTQTLHSDSKNNTNFQKGSNEDVKGTSTQSSSEQNNLSNPTPASNNNSTHSEGNGNSQRSENSSFNNSNSQNTEGSSHSQSGKH